MYNKIYYYIKIIIRHKILIDESANIYLSCVIHMSVDIYLLKHLSFKELFISLMYDPFCFANWRNFAISKEGWGNHSQRHRVEIRVSSEKWMAIIYEQSPAIRIRSSGEEEEGTAGGSL